MMTKQQFIFKYQKFLLLFFSSNELDENINPGILLMDNNNNVLIFNTLNQVFEYKNCNLNFDEYINNPNSDIYWKKYITSNDIIIPLSAKSIFRQKSYINRIIVHSNNKKYDSRDNCNAIIETQTDTLIYGCLTSKIPKSVSILGDGCFYHINSSSFTQLTIPDNINIIKPLALAQMYKVTSITIESTTLTYLSNSIVGGSISLRELILKSNQINYIDEDAFYYCAFESFIVPSPVKYIGQSAFYRCRYMKSIQLPNTLEKICSRAFEKCVSLESITFPSSLKCIEDNIFLGCNKLQKIYLMSLNFKIHISNKPIIDNIDIYLINNNNTILLPKNIFMKNYI